MGDDFLYCEQHGDLWQNDCPRCEECCLYHYGCSVQEKFNDDGSLEQRSKHWIVKEFDNFEEVKDFFKKQKKRV